MEENVGLQKLTVKTLNSKISNAVIIGIIIRSQNVRLFTSKNDNNERGVWNFTIRDTITDYINITCWGSAGFISHISTKFLVGDVVEIMRPRITIRHIDDHGEQYRPSVTSPFNLTLNEDSSSIVLHEGENYLQFLPLLHYPTKPASSYLTLTDIYINGESMRGEFVDLLVAIQFVTPLKKLKSKTDGREINKRDILVLDQTHTGLRITLWEDEFIQRAEQWKSRETILFLADMKVEWSNFEKNTIVIATSKTIITEDPLIPQADILRNYAKTVPIHTNTIVDQMINSAPDPDTITVVMTTQRVLNQAESTEFESNSKENNKFTAVLYAVITDLDLDGFTPLIVTRCDKCNKFIPKSSAICVNTDCPVSSGLEIGTPQTKFDIKVDLSDHTGSIRCKLTGQIAENVLGCTVEEFLLLSDDQRCELKWKYLMERCKVRIIVMKRDKAMPIISILSCEIADLNEVAAKLPVY